MTGAGGIRLGGVIHQAFITVDEKRTEAAAATAVIGGSDNAAAPPPAPQVTLRIDRPFILAIRHRLTDALLFLGRVQSLPPGP